MACKSDSGPTGYPASATRHWPNWSNEPSSLGIELKVCTRSRPARDVGEFQQLVTKREVVEDIVFLCNG